MKLFTTALHNDLFRLPLVHIFALPASKTYQTALPLPTGLEYTMLAGRWEPAHLPSADG